MNKRKENLVGKYIEQLQLAMTWKHECRDYMTMKKIAKKLTLALADLQIEKTTKPKKKKANVETNTLTFCEPPKMPIKIEVRETTKDTRNVGVKLRQEWCKCGADEFLCYPEDGCCTCGEHKHHVHCTCGGISQTG